MLAGRIEIEDIVDPDIVDKFVKKSGFPGLSPGASRTSTTCMKSMKPGFRAISIRRLRDHQCRRCQRHLLARKIQYPFR